jgi:hypothetical protein
MSDDLLTCERVDEDDLDTRYLAGRLSDAESAAFEEHFFACDRCWALVHRGAAISAAWAKPERQPRRWVGWVALAAASVALTVGVWRGIPRPTGPDLPDATRGVSERLMPTAQADSLELRVVWPRIAGAASYRVRLYGPDGAMLLEREVGDSSFALPRGEVTESAGALVHWQVFALDELRDEVARSGLVSSPSAH